MASSSILLNGLPGPLTATSGSTIALSNANNADAASWAWTLVDKPVGSAASLATPTLSTSSITIDKEGTYLIQLAVTSISAPLDPAVVSRTVIVIVTNITGGRFPAATENGEFDPVRGWTQAANDWFAKYENDTAQASYIYVQLTEAITTGACVRFVGSVTLNGRTIPTVAKALANSIATMPACGFVVGSYSAGTVVKAITHGPIPAGSYNIGTPPYIGYPVYVSNTGSAALTFALIDQIIGYAIDSTTFVVQIGRPAVYHGRATGENDHTLVTTISAGFMSPADKIKLNGIPTTVPSITSTAPVSIGDTNQVGVDTTAARSDHQHAHGNRTNQNDHAVATQTLAGFMSAADKVTLDQLSTGTTIPEETTRASVTTVTIYVRGFGDDTSGDGSIGAPYLSLQRALRDIPFELNNTQYVIDMANIAGAVLPIGFTFANYRSNLGPSQGSDDAQVINPAIRIVGGMTSTYTLPYVAPLPPPSNINFSNIAGSIVDGTYEYAVTALNGLGETIGTVTQYIVTGGPGGVQVTWDAVAGASSYNIYGRDPGVLGLLGNTATLSFDDDGSIAPAAAPPTVNTSGQYAIISHTGITGSSLINVKLVNSTFPLQTAQGDILTQNSTSHVVHRINSTTDIDVVGSQAISDTQVFSISAQNVSISGDLTGGIQINNSNVNIELDSLVINSSGPYAMILNSNSFVKVNNCRVIKPVLTISGRLICDTSAMTAVTPQANSNIKLVNSSVGDISCFGTATGDTLHTTVIAQTTSGLSNVHLDNSAVSLLQAISCNVLANNSTILSVESSKYSNISLANVSYVADLLAPQSTNCGIDVTSQVDSLTVGTKPARMWDDFIDPYAAFYRFESDPARNVSVVGV